MRLAALARAALRQAGVRHLDLDDAAAEVVVATWRAVVSSGHAPDPAAASEVALRRYMAGVAAHVGSHYRESACIRREELVPDAGVDSAGKTPDASDPLRHEIVRARDLEGEPMTDIASRMGMPLSTVYKVLDWGRAALRRILSAGWLLLARD